MSTEPESFLARWSRRKRAADDGKKSVDSAVPQPGTSANSADKALAPVSATTPVPESPPGTDLPLPPIESLDGLRSDYEAFFQQPVAEDLRHAALKKLFADPHFNKMDMLDVYVDDYTQFEPLPAAMKLRLASARAFLTDAERAEVEAAEARAGEAASDTEPTIADASTDAAPLPSATDTASAASNGPNGPLDTSSPARPGSRDDA